MRNHITVVFVFIVSVTIIPRFQMSCTDFYLSLLLLLYRQDQYDQVDNVIDDDVLRHHICGQQRPTVLCLIIIAYYDHFFCRCFHFTSPEPCPLPEYSKVHGMVRVRPVLLYLFIWMDLFFVRTWIRFHQTLLNKLLFLSSFQQPSGTHFQGQIHSKIEVIIIQK